MSNQGDVFEIYLMFQPFREIVPELRVLVQPLRNLEDTVPLQAEGYFSTTLDSALVALRFKRSAAADFGFARLTRWIADIGIPAIIPENLSFERRCAFFLNHLTSYGIYVQPHGSDGAGLIENVLVSLSEHAHAAPDHRIADMLARPYDSAQRRASTPLPY